MKISDFDTSSWTREELDIIENILNAISDDQEK